MNWIDVFLANDRLRPIWRFLLSLFLLFAAFAISAELLKVIFLAFRYYPGHWVGAFWGLLASLVAFLTASKFMANLLDGRPLGAVGLAFHSRWVVELGLGVAVGAGMLALAVIPEAIGGYAHFSFQPHAMLRAGTLAFILFAVAAANEEILFRGYPFQRLVEAITPAGAIAATSILFGLVHLQNPHSNWVSTCNTGLVGVTFGVAYLRTRSLWLPIGMHFIWNFLMGFFLGLPVSGIIVPTTVLSVSVYGPVWMTGGEYGPEGGIWATGAILVATGYLALTKSIYITEEMKSLVLAPVVPVRSEPPISIFPAPPQDEV